MLRSIARTVMAACLLFTVQLASDQLVVRQELGEYFHVNLISKGRGPVIVRPKDPTLKFREVSYILDVYRDAFRSLLHRHKGILFRGFDVKEAAEFKRLLQLLLAREPMVYTGGDGSRHQVLPGVYTSTEAPAQFAIPLHHELSCTQNPAQYIAFYCDTPPEEGGKTVMGMTREVTEKIKSKYPHVWKAFKGKSLRYVSRHPADRNFYTDMNPSHKTWKESFGTSDRTKVEEICRQKGFEARWTDDWLEVARKAPAMAKLDVFDKVGEDFATTKEMLCWYNQAHLYHRNPNIRGGYLNYVLAELLYWSPETMQYDVTFADGTPISSDLLDPVYKVLRESQFGLRWQKGDVLLLDNQHVMHGKTPHEGERRILVSLFTHEK